MAYQTIPAGSTSGDASLLTGDSADIAVDDNVQNASSTVQTLTHTYNAGAGAANIGAAQLFRAESATAGTNATAVSVRGVLTTATAGAEVGAYRVAIVNAGSLQSEGAEPLQVTPTAGGTIVVDNATNNNLTTVARLRHTTSGAPAAFIGTSMELETESAGGVVTAVRVTGNLSTVTGGAEVGQWRVAIMDAGTLPAYGSEQIICTAAGLFTLTAANPTHRLVASGSGGIEVNTTGTGGQSYISCTGDTGKALFFIQNDSARASTLCGLNNADLAAVYASGTPSNALIVASSNLYLAGNTTAVGLRVTTTNSVAIGPSGALATDATDGFLYIPSCAGTPTGAPTAVTGKVAMVFDTTGNKLWIYDGAWLGGTAPGAWS